MKLGTGFLLIVVGQALRLGSGMVVFVIVARLLGPAAFGSFAYWLAIATLCTIPINFGFGTPVLKSFGDSSNIAIDTLRAVLTAKLVLAAAVLFSALLFLPFLDGTTRLLFFALLIAQTSESFAEFYVLGFRIQSHYKSESFTASIVSVVHIAVMLVVAYVFRDLLVIAFAFMASRMIGLLITRHRSESLTGAIGLGSVKRVPKTLKDAWAYALELGLLTVYGQVDTLLINHLLGSTAVGLYQAGMKLVQGASRLAPILAQVLLPTLARKAASPNDFKTSAMQTLAVFAAAGLVGMLVLALFAEQLTSSLFGHAYRTLVPLLPLFGALLFTRFVETGMGLILVARGQQTKKVWFVGAQLVLLVAVGYAALRFAGLGGWLIANICSVGGLLAAYGLLMRHPITGNLSGRVK